MKRHKVIWIVIYCLMTVWFFYQVNILKNGYQRYFIMFMAFVSICLILITVYDIKPLLRKKKKE
jgi:membrane protein DedA with SNARE-associated domain